MIRTPELGLDLRPLLRLLTIACLFVLAAYVGQSPSWELLRLFVLLGGAVSLAVLLRYPQLRLPTLVVASFIIPLSISTGTNTDLNVTVLLLPVFIGLWLLELLQRREIRLPSSRPVLPLMAFALVAVLSFGMGQLPWYLTESAPLLAQLGGLAVFLLSAGAFLLVAHHVRDLQSLEWLTWLFLAFGALFLAGRLVPGLRHVVVDILFQEGSTSSLFWVWVAALAFGQALFNRRLPPRWRLACGGLVLVLFYSAWFEGRTWASGWLPPLVAVGTILWLGVPRLRPLMLLSGAAIATFYSRQVVAEVMVGNEYSWITRLEAWRIVLEIVKVSPLLGLGPANYHWYTPLFPILGWSVQFNSHNQYVDILAQTGVLGLAGFLWFAWEVFWLGWRLRDRVATGFAQAYVYGALGGLAGTLAAGALADWVLPFVYNVGLKGMRSSIFGWIFLGGLVALELMVTNGSGAQQNGEDPLPPRSFGR
ncbi:MAG TPA: hypothetical protein DEP84_06550 [Chloroflexi bacterium]|nr:hypothetical protein [Chloroflexota bacterium]